MSVFFITLILLVGVFFVRVIKAMREPFQENEQICDLEVFTDMQDTFQEEVSYTNNVKKDIHKEGDEIEQIEKEEKQILSVEQDKKFSLRDAVIYSTILERPYK